MDKLFGYGWRLVLKASPPPTMVPALDALPMPVTLVRLGEVQEADAVLENWFGAQQCSAALVRPDHYVYGVAADARQLAGLIATLKQQLAPRN